MEKLILFPVTKPISLPICILVGLQTFAIQFVLILHFTIFSPLQMRESLQKILSTDTQPTVLMPKSSAAYWTLHTGRLSDLTTFFLHSTFRPICFAGIAKAVQDSMMTIYPISVYPAVRGLEYILEKAICSRVEKYETVLWCKLKISWNSILLVPSFRIVTAENTGNSDFSVCANLHLI